MKQVAVLDAEERLILLDGGTVEECEDGIVVSLASVDFEKGDRSLSYYPGLASARILNGKMVFVNEDYLYNDEVFVEEEL